MAKKFIQAAIALVLVAGAAIALLLAIPSIPNGPARGLQPYITPYLDKSNHTTCAPEYAPACDRIVQAVAGVVVYDISLSIIGFVTERTSR